MIMRKQRNVLLAIVIVLLIGIAWAIDERNELIKENKIIKAQKCKMYQKLRGK